jgi:hypothetical protein
MALPGAVQQLADLNVSLKRIGDFLNSEEI